MILHIVWYETCHNRLVYMCVGYTYSDSKMLPRHCIPMCLLPGNFIFEWRKLFKSTNRLYKSVRWLYELALDVFPDSVMLSYLYYRINIFFNWISNQVNNESMTKSYHWKNTSFCRTWSFLVWNLTSYTPYLQFPAFSAAISLSLNSSYVASETNIYYKHVAVIFHMKPVCDDRPSIITASLNSAIMLQD